MSKVAHQPRTYSGFSSMKRLGVFLPPRPPPPEGYPQHLSRRYSFTNLGEERYCETKVSGTQYSISSKGSNPDLSIRTFDF